MLCNSPSALIVVPVKTRACSAAARRPPSVWRGARTQAAAGVDALLNNCVDEIEIPGWGSARSVIRSAVVLPALHFQILKS